MVQSSPEVADRAQILLVRSGAVADLNVVAPARIAGAVVQNVAVLAQNVVGVARSEAADHCALAWNVVEAVLNAAADRDALVRMAEAAVRNWELGRRGELATLSAVPARRFSLAYGGDLSACQSPRFAAAASALVVRIWARFVQADRFSGVCPGSRMARRYRAGKVAKEHLTVYAQTAWYHFDP